MNHSTSKRTAKALPQREATVFIEGIDKKLIKCTARKAFTVGNSSVKEGETFFLVASERREHRYYVVHFDSAQNRPQCSCGANHKSHSHIDAYGSYIQEHVVNAKSESVNETPAQPVESSSQIIASQAEQYDGSRPLTAAEWKEITRRDKARQKAEKAADWAKIEEAREQAKREATLAG